jgi:hypothetical protein
LSAIRYGDFSVGRQRRGGSSSSQYYPREYKYNYDQSPESSSPSRRRGETKPPKPEDVPSHQGTMLFNPDKGLHLFGKF